MGAAGLTPRVCLIVDNPLRDLDGLVLVAWHLAQQGAEVWLVPMYEQGFDVWAIRPDFVLANYVRSNNAAHLRSYRRAGIQVGVLDTEGVGGKNADEFASLVASTGVASELDLYCVWGEEQFLALQQHGVVPADRLRLTGCPRYDYCASPWQATLPAPSVAPGYVLVNTNFPIVNPRFSRGSADERAAMLSAGFDPTFADAYVRDARSAHQGVVRMLEELVDGFRRQQFVLRPHPFEATAPYEHLRKHPNFEVRQEGTSVEWIRHCRALVHLNCSTAIEAAMFGKPALSPGWLDTPALNVPRPHAVSRHAASAAELHTLLEAALAGDTGRVPECERTLRAAYYRIDGAAAERVADAVLDCLGRSPAPGPAGGNPLRWRTAQMVRRAMGPKAASRLRHWREDPALEKRRAAKRFTSEGVGEIVARLQACSVGSRPLSVRSMADAPLHRRWLATGESVRVCVEPL